MPTWSIVLLTIYGLIAFIGGIFLEIYGAASWDNDHPCYRNEALKDKEAFKSWFIVGFTWVKYIKADIKELNYNKVGTAILLSLIFIFGLPMSILIAVIGSIVGSFIWLFNLCFKKRESK